MTQQSRTVNKARFEQGDKPQGSDYVDVFDSFLSLVDASAQAITSDISTPNLSVTSVVSADTVRTSAFGFHTTVTALSTAQTSAMLRDTGGRLSLMRMTINGSDVAVLYTSVGTLV